METVTRREQYPLSAAIVAAALVLASPAGAQDAVAECDRLAASDLDRGRPATVPGVIFLRIDSQAAMAACIAAAKAPPGNARLYFQLGLAFAAAKQFENARTAFNVAIERGSLPALIAFADLYMRGEGVARDFARANGLYEKAAKAGLPLAMFRLGAVYRDGQGVARDPQRAGYWYRQARAAFQDDIKLGSASAMHIVGVMHEFGWGGPQDHAQARAMYEKAAKLGHPLSQKGLQRLGEKWKP
jgi:TPR repeat protein